MNTREILRRHFPALLQGNDPAVDEVFARVARVTVPRGEIVFDTGSPCKHYLLVIGGSVRVEMLTRSGREALLYRVRSGQSCIFTTSCLLGHASYPARGYAETEVDALALGVADFERGIDRSPVFRRFVFHNLGQRLSDVLERLEALNFTSIDSRLADTLLRLGEQGDRIPVTHGALAEEVGTAREVITRHLKRFAGRGLLRLERGSIELLDREQLKEIRVNDV